MNITPDEFDAAFGGIIDAFNRQATDDLKKDVRASGDVALASVRAGSPVRAASGGGYKAGWRLKMHLTVTGFYIRIYNTKKPGLAHLLEKGHALRDGGFSRKFPHIEPAYKTGLSDLNRRLKL